MKNDGHERLFYMFYWNKTKNFLRAYGAHLNIDDTLLQILTKMKN